ncbi:ppsC, partial [Symbiodinium pilosum]
MALGELACLQAGQRVLVHAGAGGVGLTAVQYALRLGAVVYATAGNQDKQNYLLQMGVKCVTSSRDGQKFQEQMATALADENNAQLDVVLNRTESLPSRGHDNFIGRSLSFLRDGGVFIEIGKRGIWTHDDMTKVRPKVQYKVLAMDTICNEDPAQMVDGAWEPLPFRVFEGLGACSEALQVLRKAEQIGKIVLSVPSPLRIREGATYLITGGTGALGLAVSRALLEEGAEATQQGDLGSETQAREFLMQKDVDKL